jgi:hypothetical protein
MNRKFDFLLIAFLILVSPALQANSRQLADFDQCGNFSTIAVGFYLNEKKSVLYVPAEAVFGKNLQEPSGFLSCLKIENTLIVNGEVSLIASETELLELKERFEKKTGHKADVCSVLPAEFSMQIKVNGRVVFVKKRSGGSFRRFPVQFQTRDLKPEEVRIKIVWEIFPERELWGNFIAWKPDPGMAFPIARTLGSSKVTIQKDRIVVENNFISPFKEVREFKRN